MTMHFIRCLIQCVDHNHKRCVEHCTVPFSRFPLRLSAIDISPFSRSDLSTSSSEMAPSCILSIVGCFDLFEFLITVCS